MRRRLLFLAVLFSCLLSSAEADTPRADQALRRAVNDLIATFGERYPDGRKYLARLDELTGGGKSRPKHAAAFEKLRREALLSNPLLRDHPILFVTRHQYSNEHGTEATMYQTKQINTKCFHGGGAIRLLDVTTGKATTLASFPNGVARDPEAHFDGRRILFSMRRDIRDDYHLYEINADGTGLRQLTSAPEISDIQPIYLPDDSIAFSSTRDPKYIPCQRHLMANLFRMNADGSNIRQIGYNTQFEGRASLMPDGRILYTRWEYVDKHFASAYGLWTVNPDGTDHALYYGNYAWQPGAIVDARIVPGTRNFISVFTAVHELGWGALVIADRARGLEGMEPILHSWPADITPFMRRWSVEERIGNGYDSFMKVKVKYEDPYPLSAKHFLCARQLARKGRTGIFLVDLFGNELLVHEEPPGCFDPMPLAPRPRPPTLPSEVDYTRDDGTFYVGDVYTGEAMDRVKRGSVKYLRVVEAPPKRSWVPRGMGDWAPFGSGDSHHPVALNWNHYNAKRILGTVPVEEDGSAYFRVPAGRFVYFQLLDGNGMMIHSMRSGTMLQPGERKGCVGCHESPLKAVPSLLSEADALKHAPRDLDPWHGPERDFSYAVEVQPVLDRHCVSCHDYDGEAKELNLSGDKGIIFSHSYTNLMRLSPSEYRRAEHERAETMPLVSSVGAGPIKPLPPYSWGSHRSRLVKLLRDGHYDVKLDRESFDRIVTWIDLNIPYYPSHLSYYVSHTGGRSPLDHKDLLELGRLVSQTPRGTPLGWNKVNEYLCNRIGRVMAEHGPPVNFTRPELSACLRAFPGGDDPGYRRALELIRKGAKNLKEHPRCDMPGFVPCEAHRRQQDFLGKRQRIEARNREALVKGQKVFDTDPGSK